LLAGPAVVYGILRGCGAIIHQAQWIGRTFYHIDHGYFGRGHYEGYYRISADGLQCRISDLSDFGSARFERLEIRPRPWARSGRKILVAPISQAVGEFLGIDTHRWLETVIREIKSHTDRPIEIKQKHEGDIRAVLEDTWCLVTHASNAAIDALVAGIPVIALGHSAVAHISWRWENIEKPIWYDREPLFWALAHHQWRIEEMKSGEAWTTLTATG